jgi:hypothetical protein
VWRGLLGGQQSVVEPAADRGRREAELVRCLLDRDGLAVGVDRWRDRYPCALADAAHPGFAEWQTGAGAPALLVEDRGDLAVGWCAASPRMSSMVSSAVR